jgi:hypothetical protein
VEAGAGGRGGEGNFRRGWSMTGHERRSRPPETAHRPT